SSRGLYARCVRGCTRRTSPSTPQLDRERAEPRLSKRVLTAHGARKRDSGLACPAELDERNGLGERRTSVVVSRWRAEPFRRPPRAAERGGDLVLLVAEVAPNRPAEGHV